MELTLTPNFEQEVIHEIRARDSAKPAQTVFFRLARFAARQRKGSIGYWLVRAIAGFVVRRVESRNNSISNEVRWFQTATKELAEQVAITDVPAGEKLGSALAGLVQRVDSCVSNLQPLLSQVNANTPFGSAVHRSMFLLLNLRTAAVEMQRAGRLIETADGHTQRIESATNRMASVYAVPTRGMRHDAEDLALAREAVVRSRERAKTLASRSPSSQPSCHV